MIYYKQEKFNLAEIHFKKAFSINPQSSVLLCHIGVVSNKLLNSYRESAKTQSVTESNVITQMIFKCIISGTGSSSLDLHVL